MNVCRLCGKKAKLVNSHIISKFVSETIKQNSPTGFLRCVSDMNKRRQDGDKVRLLCTDCEGLFSKAEKEFAEHVFKPFQAGYVPPVSYGPWMNYFISSVNWRTLHLDNCGFRTSDKYSQENLAPFYEAERVLADFLLERRDDIGNIENHIFFLENLDTNDPELVSARPNTMIRSSVFGYSLFDTGRNAYYVYANLAGIFIFTVVRKGLGESWVNTKVNLDRGEIIGSQRICSSTLDNEVRQTIIEMSNADMSEKQYNKLVDFRNTNPAVIENSKAFRFHKQDKNLRDNLNP